MRRVQVLVVVFVASLQTALSAQEMQVGPKQAVMALVAGFNEHDVAEMLEASANDVSWMSVNADTLAVETMGWEAGGEQRTQCSAAIYEVKNGKV